MSRQRLKYVLLSGSRGQQKYLMAYENRSSQLRVRCGNSYWCTACRPGREDIVHMMGAG